MLYGCQRVDAPYNCPIGMVGVIKVMLPVVGGIQWLGIKKGKKRNNNNIYIIYIYNNNKNIKNILDSQKNYAEKYPDINKKYVAF